LGVTVLFKAVEFPRDPAAKAGIRARHRILDIRHGMKNAVIKERRFLLRLDLNFIRNSIKNPYL
jgi:hypothetical protein